MDIQNIKALAALLEKLGFSKNLDEKIAYHACFRQKEFTIKERQSFGEDVMTYNISFRENGTSRKLACTHYDASLRKNIIMLPSAINKIDVHQLDERMNNVNWELVSQFKMAPQSHLAEKETWNEQEGIERIILDLEALASSDEGGLIADSLKYKYWIDLPFESMISNLYALRSKFEFMQRFYIIGNEGITAHEAFRFLNNKWMQRQVQIEKQNSFKLEAVMRQSKELKKGSKIQKRKAKEQ